MVKETRRKGLERDPVRENGKTGTVTGVTRDTGPIGWSGGVTGQSTDP